MSRRTLIVSLALAALFFAAAAPAPAAAAPAPAWQLQLTPLPAHFAPGTQREYMLVATNVGAAPTEAASPVSLEVTLPPGLTPSSVKAKTDDPSDAAPPACTLAGQTATCLTGEVLHSGFQLLVLVRGVAVEAPAGTAPVASAAIVGGGALQSAGASVPTPISAAAAPFGFQAFGAPLTDEEGAPATLAGSHPHQLTLDMTFPAAQFGEEITGAGHVRDAFGELPRGLLGDPAATPVRCTEVELLQATPLTTGCPPASQIGLATVTSSLGPAGTVGVSEEPLFNMVPPPGTPASFGFDAVGVGIFIHVLSGVRSDGDFGLYGYSEDIPALGTHSLLGFQLQLWGDPSASSHDAIRGSCIIGNGSCPVAPQKISFLTTPGNCSGQPLSFEARADSWEQPGGFQTARYQSADLEGNSVSLGGCGQLPFAPTISSQPTTDLADSPTGLDFDLRQPVDLDTEHRSSAFLRDATVTLPQGMSVNPSQADGLGACSEQQIGYLSEDEEAGVHFSKDPQSCPAASKLGTMEVSSPLLAQYTEDGTKLLTDPETGEPLPRPLHGVVYLAEPFDNPFGTLLGIYLVIEDEESGIVAKLAGKVEPDSQTGQLTTVFTENPELPLSDIRISLFKGARASLITPLTCGAHATTTTLTPWSSPEGAAAHPTDSFQTTTEPGGGSCPSSAGAAANKPAFTAGTISLQAGAYSPFVLKLSREDGSQRLAGLDTTLAPGLTGKLAGIGQCSEAQIAQAQSRSKPEEGILERRSSSCPASSEVGTVDVAAGAGPTPFYTTGHAYLAGPYKGAPLSLAAIVPAIAGPFDLGTVVTRVALYVNPESAQIHAVSDPFPQILDGIPLDVRSIALTMGRPDFTLNPTSCDPMKITGQATSSLGQGASLASPFQVGGCQGLAFKPKLVLKLNGPTGRSGNPALRATLTMPSGGANIAAASVALPHSEFLDQAHIKTICTRVQFAEGGGHGERCPPGSVYGHARAITPLLDAPLEGPVYLRSSSNPLPDLVAALNGQIDVDLDGRVDSHNGGIRNSFEVVPDAPVSKFVLTMQGGKKGLLENSRNLCKSVNRATVQFTGQNGKVSDSRPLVRNSCKGKPGKHKKHRRSHHRGR